ncbi:MAG: DUF1461 domain-containing protein [Chloroflexota bacterium]
MKLHYDFDPILLRGIHFLIVLCFPLLAGAGAITATVHLIDLPYWSYQHLPADAYGWSHEQRLILAGETLGYLRGNQPTAEAIQLLEALALPEDVEERLYNDRELAHMRDVKEIVDVALNICTSLMVLTLLGLIVIALYQPYLLSKVALQSGWWSLMLGGSVGGVIWCFWDWFFITFHELLFPVGSYTFEWTDSLIRLFPPQFWMDSAISIVGMAMLGSIFLIVIGEATNKTEAVSANRKFS